MSQIWYEETSLDSVVRRATHVLVVEPADPPFRHEMIPIDQPTYDGVACPPFSLRWDRFRVIEVVRAPSRFEARVVEVAPSDWNGGLDTHIDYYVEGLSQSPIVESYEAQGDTSSDRLIVFANSSQRGLTYVVSGALEGVDMLGRVRQLVESGGQLEEGSEPGFEISAFDVHDDEG